MDSRHMKTRKNTKVGYNLKKICPLKPSRENNDIYVTTKTDIKAQREKCEKILNSGENNINLHCLGNAINCGVNLALQLVNSSCGSLSYIIKTSTIQLIDENHPLFDGDELTLLQRNNSALHINIFKC